MARRIIHHSYLDTTAISADLEVMMRNQDFLNYTLADLMNQPLDYVDGWADTFDVETGVHTAYTLIAQATGTGITNGGQNPNAHFDGTTSQTGANSTARISNTTIYAGKNYTAAPKRVAKAIAYAPNNAGFGSTGGTITIQLRGHSSAPSAGTEGTLLGTSGAFANATGLIKEILSTDAETQWNYVWLYISGATGDTIIAEAEFYEFATGSSANQSYNAAGDYYEPTTPSAPSTAYANAGGSGNRAGVVTLTTNIVWEAGTSDLLLDGTLSGSQTNPTNSPGAGIYFQFDYGSGNKKYIDELKIYANTDTPSVALKAQYSNDGSSWTDLNSFTWNSLSFTQAITGMPVTGARYFRLLCTSATPSFAGFFMNEFEFKIAAGGAVDYNNMTLISTTKVANDNVGEFVGYVEVDYSGSLTPGTDFDFAASANAGSAFTSTGATYDLVYSVGTVKRYRVTGIDLSAQNDNDVRVRVRTLTNLNIKVSGWNNRWADAA